MRGLSRDCGGEPAAFSLALLRLDDTWYGYNAERRVRAVTQPEKGCEDVLTSNGGVETALPLAILRMLQRALAAYVLFVMPSDAGKLWVRGDRKKET